MGCQCTIKSQLHHEGLRVRQLLFLGAIERQRNEEVLAQDPLDNLQMLIWIISLAQCLLTCCLIRSLEHGTL